MAKYKLVVTDETPCCESPQYALIRDDGEIMCIHAGLEDCATDHLEEAIDVLRAINERSPQ